MATENGSQTVFPYVPFKTFVTFIHHLQETVVTDQIDYTMMPSGFSGTSRAWVLSALKALKLVDANNNSTPKLKELVEAYQTDDWPSKVKDYILSAYTNIPDGVDLKSITPKQLEDAFGGMTQQMRDKSIRFFLAANKEAGIKCSPHLKIRKPSAKKPSEGRTRKSTRTTPVTSPVAPKLPEQDKTPPNMVDLPILGLSDSLVRVPQNISVNQITLVRAAVDYLEAMAKQNEGGKE